MPRQALVERQVAEQAARMSVRDRRFRQIRVHRRRADPDQHRIIMRVETFRRTHVDRRIGSQPLADEMRVNRRRRQHPRDRDAVLGYRLVGQEQFALALAHRLFGFAPDPLDRGAQAFGAAPPPRRCSRSRRPQTQNASSAAPTPRRSARVNPIPVRASADPRYRGYWRGSRTASSATSHGVRARSRSAGSSPG